MGFELPDELKALKQDIELREPAPEPMGTLERFFVLNKQEWIAVDAPNKAAAEGFALVNWGAPAEDIYAEEPESPFILKGKANVVTGQVEWLR
jgi:hypothetical protein